MKRFSALKFRESRRAKTIAAFTACTVLFQLMYPTTSYALTSGPGQEEFSSFEPATTSDMVDLYSGDFTYNIPLLSVPGPNGGYPLNLAYHGGVGMEQEASWVGLGWNLNVGAINRSMQGLPDDFNGDKVEYEQHMRKSWSASLNLDGLLSKVEDSEWWGFPYSTTSDWDDSEWRISPSQQLYFNNYRGLGYRVNLGIRKLGKSQNFVDASFGISLDSQEGVGISANSSLSFLHTSFGTSLSYSPRKGLESIGFTTGVNRDKEKEVDYERTETTRFSHLASSSLSVASTGNLPSVGIPTKSVSFPFSVKVGDMKGTAKWGANKHLNISGHYNTSFEIDNGESSVEGYGYLYKESAGSDDLKDFEREGILETKKTRYLAPSRYTYDHFMHTGQGTGGTFRPMRNSVSILSSNYKESVSTNYNLGVEVASPVAAHPAKWHLGLDYVKGISKQSSGDWSDGVTDNNATFGTSATDREPYFKTYGEHSATLVGNDKLTSAWAGDEAIKPVLDDENGTTGSAIEKWLDGHYTITDEFTTYNEYYGNDYDAGTTDMKYTKTTKERGKMIRTLSQTEAELFGYYQETNKSFSDTEKDDHISEIQVTQQDGLRYIYGLPAYNKKHNNVSMSLGDNVARDYNTNIVDVDADDYLAPGVGTAHEYFNKSIIPDYAHSWLLTSVLSSDYADIDGVQGPSEGDLGYWTKFTYDRAITDYSWRMPFQGATYAEGNPGNNDDDRAFFTYGEKEVFYIETIETKTHIAVFATSDRKDGYEAASEYAKTADGTGTDMLKKLNTIKLYTKKEYYDENGDVNTSAIPLQTVHFKYNYDLCKGVLNNPTGGTLDSHESSDQGGKLTLEKVWFTYENSTRGELSPYTFDYDASTGTSNPDYNSRNVDRWGNYKNNDQYTAGSCYYPYVNFPYSEQGEEEYMDNNGSTTGSTSRPDAGVWCLKSVNLPTGGVFNVEYESDDYAYNEAEKATRMFDIVGIGDVETAGAYGPDRAYYYLNNGIMTQVSSDIEMEDLVRNLGSSSVRLANASNFDDDNSTNYKDRIFRVYFRLEEEISSSATDAEVNAIIRDQYVGDMDYLYFKNYTYLREETSGEDKLKDYVEGYAELRSGSDRNYFKFFGAVKLDGSTDYNVGYVTVKPVSVTKDGTPKMSPFQKAAIEHLRINRSEIAHDHTVTDEGAVDNIVSISHIAINSLNDVVGMIAGYNRWAKAQGWGQYVELNGRSIIRLQDPDGVKYGGGDRVKKFTLSDGWATESVYGQEYDYTTTDKDGNVISSGVAYEPSVGKEENALTQYEPYFESTPLASAYSLMSVLPILNSYYPGQSVGYSKVTVSSIAPEEADKAQDIRNSEGVDGTDEIHLAANSAPIAVYEFYTGKDFPVYCDATAIEAEPNMFRIVPIPGITIDYRAKRAKSQGYSIVLNDMAGKMKKVESYTREYSDVGGKRVSSPGSLITRTEYIYQTKEAFSDDKVNKLDNEVQVLTDNGEYQSAIMAQTVDIHIDRNENKNSGVTKGVNLNLEFGVITAAPYIPIPIPLPQFYTSEVSHKSVVTNKVIHRSGILKKTVVTTDASRIETENMAFDPYTGNALLTKVTNEFSDPLYAYNIPAYWEYGGTGAVYDRYHGGGDATNISTGGIVNLDAGHDASEYSVGDEVYLYYTSSETGELAHVIDVHTGNNTIKCITNNGSATSTYTGSIDVHMVRPVERNMLLASIGSESFRELSGFDEDTHSSATTFTKDKILSASAVELSDEWQLDCEGCSKEDSRNPLDNAIGDAANPFVNGVKGHWRVKSSYAYKTDRVYDDNEQTDGYYEDYAQFNWASPSSSSSKWIKAGEVTKFSPYGFELEEKDALGRYSAALYGYANSLVVAVGANMRYTEMVFDGFEDYPRECTDDHFVIDVDGTAGASITSLEDQIAHTGDYSLKLTTGTSLTVAIDTIGDSCLNHSPTFTSGSSPYYTVEGCDCIGEFGPMRGALKYKYVFSAWVKEATESYTYNDVVLKVNVYEDGQSTVTVPLSPSGKVIEGWQRIYGEIELPELLNKIDVVFQNNSTGDVYFDDLRIHPYKGNMTSYVYNQNNYKLEAELDANNFATIYIYDDEGNLVLIKKETAEGIKSIQEGRISTSHED